jgi:succinoglycan biosynthesis transport protein ExoP
MMATNLEVRQEGELFQILTPANLPNTPSSPNRQLFALGGLGGGMVLGLGLTFLLEIRNTSLRTERDVELLIQFPVLAVVPTLKPVSR